MTGGSSLAFPGGRTLTAWWRQLAGHQPQALWVGYLTFHRLEALVCVLQPQSLPSFELLVLKAFALQPAAGNTALAAFLHLDAGLVGRVIRYLQSEGLVRAEAGARALTESGRQAAAQGEYPRAQQQRRPFYFWHASWCEPARSRYVALANVDKQPWLAAPEIPCAVDPLEACLSQPAEWKRRHGFPQEVRKLLTSSGWEQVVLAAPLRLFAAVVRTAALQLVAVAVQPRNWELQAGHPVLLVPDEDWMPAATDQEWRQSFVDWCRERQIAEEEASACTLTWQDERLLVLGPMAVEERLRLAKGEAWVLAGDGLVRPAARLEAV
jgi:DNA-binding MarR family transcriptional regulator